MEFNLTTFLAVWGALLSSVGLGWNLFRDLNNRGRLRVSCYLANLVSEGEGVDPNTYLTWCVTNIGKQPIMVTHIGGARKDCHFMIKTKNILPKMLQPGEYFLECSSELTILKDDLKTLHAIDSLNKYYKAPGKVVKKLKEDFKQKKYE